MLIDNSAIEAANEDFVRNSPAAMCNVELCYAAVDLLRAAAELPSFSTPDDVTMLRLAVRLINDAGACGTCALGGYYQQAAAHIRDIIEVEFLLDLFRRQPKEINRWRVCGHKARQKYFKPSAIRKRLDRLDGFTNKPRDALYKLFSDVGTHANPDGFTIISPNALTQVGPFPSEKVVIALSFDLARVLGHAAWHIARWVDLRRESSQPHQLKFAAAWQALNDQLLRYYEQSADLAPADIESAPPQPTEP